MDSQTDNETFDAAQVDLNKLVELINEIFDKQDKNSRLLNQVLHENVNFQNQVRQGMYNEIEEMKKQQRGEQFTPILKSLAAICVEYRTILNDDTLSPNTRRTLQLMFEEMEDILAEYGAEIFNSKIGEPRRPLLTKIINTISTNNKENHNTIAKSRRAGVVRNGRPLYREFVDVFVFDPTFVNQNEPTTDNN
jgi:hypothetical protein